MFRPETVAEIEQILVDATRTGGSVEIRGGGSKSQIGRPDRECVRIEMSGFKDVVSYDPPELVLTVGAGMPLAQVQALVDERSQMLAFEPFDHGPLFGRAQGQATIGGIIAAGVSGSRRLSAGAVRDHLLGFEGVSGRGERFVAGGRVVKNVTGYDLPKLMAGSWGQLAVLTTVTLKVLPKPRTSATVVLHGLDDAAAIAAMSTAMRSQAEVAAAAHLPGQPASTALRVEGFGPSVTARVALLQSLLASFGTVDVLGESAARLLWANVRDVTPLNDGRPLWRINVPASKGAVVTAALQTHGARWFYDWAGGLIWLTLGPETDAARVRTAAENAGGHAMLVRADGALRARVPALHPESEGVAALSQRVKAAFDPAGVLDPHRFD